MADINLNVIIKDAYRQRVIDAINGGVGRDVSLAIYGNGVGDSISFIYDPQGGDSSKVFAEKLLKKLLTSFVRAYELAQDTTRYNNDKNAVVLPSQSVPDEIVE